LQIADCRLQSAIVNLQSSLPTASAAAAARGVSRDGAFASTAASG
jgi:hypothetical protein